MALGHGIFVLIRKAARCRKSNVQPAIPSSEKRQQPFLVACMAARYGERDVSGDFAKLIKHQIATR